MMPLPGSSLPVDLVEHFLVDETDLDDDLSFASDVDGLDSSDDECSSSDDESSSTDFILDMRLLEEDNHLQEEFRRRRRERRRSSSQQDQEEDPLETDSLKLIRRRVPQQERRAPAPEPSITPSGSPSVIKRLDSGSSPFQVCEVPLGVSLKDILPSMFRKDVNFHSAFPGGSSSPRTSGGLMEGIDKALEIVTLSAQESM
jgi:hypothetical protein